jgi:hypothetical protein
MGGSRREGGTVLEQPGDVIGRGTVVLESTLRPGDRITEVDTPEGAWYPVTRVTGKSFWLDLGDGAEARFAIRPRHIVLRAD